MAFETRAEVFDDIAPHPDGIDADQLIHERAYVVRAYRLDAQTLVLRGSIRDQKPPGLYIPEDPEPLTVHHMIVDLTIAVPSLEIIRANAVLETHPHSGCPRIQDHYGNLVGLSIARGFTHKVRELFGGPRGCTHTTALLQAMGPVAVQSMWSFRFADANQNGETSMMNSQPSREAALATNLNTCHIWAEDGEQAQLIRSGQPMETPVWLEKRVSQLGIAPGRWATDV
jgi:hypothetical protein